MSQVNLIALAESCSAVRASIGRMLMSGEETPGRAAALASYRKSLRELLRIAREEEYGTYMEVAGELPPRD